MDIKFSIITVCYNSGKTIERTIQSVLNQSYHNYEYIIIDGASTDNTLEIVRKYEPQFQEKMKIVSEPDRGIYDAMNKGIALASGELIGIVNSDDYYETDALENIMKTYDGYEYSIVYGLLRKVQAGKEVMVYSKNHDFLDREMITHPTCFVSRKIYQDFGTYSLEYPYSADYEFMLRMSRHKQVKFEESYCLISNFSIDGASSSVKAYRDTLRLKKCYELISPKEYYFEMIKSWIALILGK